MPDTRSRPEVKAFFHADTNTFTYVVHEGRSAVVIDPVLDYDAAAARVSTVQADAVLAYVKEHRLTVEWILETHAHADHLSAGDHLRDALGARLAIGRGITQVQARFKALFGMGDEFVPDGRQFDQLLDDGDVMPRACIARSTASSRCRKTPACSFATTTRPHRAAPKRRPASPPSAKKTSTSATARRRTASSPCAPRATPRCRCRA